MKHNPNAALRHARKKLELTQHDVADRARISESSYKRYELGTREPSVRIANRIARALHSTAEELFGI